MVVGADYGTIPNQKTSLFRHSRMSRGATGCEVTAVMDLKGRANHPGEPRLGEDASPYHPTSISYGTLV
jgi:hypothetical protein